MNYLLCLFLIGSLCVSMTGCAKNPNPNDPYQSYQNTYNNPDYPGDGSEVAPPKKKHPFLGACLVGGGLVAGSMFGHRFVNDPKFAMGVMKNSFGSARRVVKLN